ncbi:MAG: DUF6531 domain-containing protein, partial [Acidobacteriota bacterium]
MRLKAGQKTDVDPVLLRRDEVDRYRSQASRQLVGASVVVEGGALSVLTPIEAYAFPGPVDSVERANDPGTQFLFGNLGRFSDTLRLLVLDAFGNPVANADLTAVALPPDTTAFQAIPNGDAAPISCLIPPEDEILNLSVFEAALDVSGSYTSCEQSTPTVGGCGRPLLTLETDWHGEAYVGVILGDSIVEYRVGVRRSLDADLTCEQLATGADEPIEEACEDLYPPDVDGDTDLYNFRFFYSYSPAINVRTAFLPGAQPCEPTVSTQGRAENFGANAAANALGELPHPLRYAFYTLTNSCESGGPPVCQDPPSCGDDCAGEEDCSPCPCDGCVAGECSQCQFVWDMCTTEVDGRIFPNGLCFIQYAGMCVFPSTVCDDTRWSMLPTPISSYPVPELELTNEGVVGPIGLAEPNVIDARLFGGGTPGENVLSGENHYYVPFLASDLEGELFLTDSRNAASIGNFRYTDPNITSFYSLDPRILSVEPEVVPLSDDGVSLSEIVVRYRVDPEEYVAQRVEVRMWQNLEDVIAVASGSASGEGVAVLPRGLNLEGFAAHDLQLVVNPGLLYEVKSDFLPLQTSQRLIRSYSPSIRLSQETDLVNGSICTDPVDFTFSLNTDADVRLEALPINGQDALSGEVDIGIAFPLFTSSYPAKEIDAEGNEVFIVHSEELTIDDLPPGDYVLNLVATSQDGSEVRQARALSELRVTDQLPLGHTLIKGVDLWNGALTMSHQDFTVPGRGPDLDFSRSYSSSAAQVDGPLGLGWRHNWQSELRVTPC